MISNKKYIIVFMFFISVNWIYSQNISERYKDIYTNETLAINMTSFGDSYDFMALRQHLGALNMIIKETKDEEIIQKQIRLIDNLLNSSRTSNSILNNKYKFKDEFKGWTAKKDKKTANQEVPLFESYSFLYVAEFLYLLKEIDWINKSSENKEWWKSTVVFVEQNIWRKWRTRSYQANKVYNQIFLRSRTHMGAHWAGIASYLQEITDDDKIKVQTIELLKQYDKLLKRNLKMVNGSYIWNSTYNDVTNTDAISTKEAIIQDVSHGNHVVTYIVLAYELGNENWTKTDLLCLSKTVTKILYDEKTNTFADNVDGSIDKERPGWGNFVGDGWVKLGYYDTEVAKVFKTFSTNKKLLKRYYQSLQFKATILGYDSLKN